MCPKGLYFAHRGFDSEKSNPVAVRLLNVPQDKYGTQREDKEASSIFLYPSPPHTFNLVDIIPYLE